MSRKIKLIWEFRGRDVEHFASHHAEHLAEFIEKYNYELKETGFEVLNENFAMAFMIVKESDLMKFRDVLKPHKAVYVAQ